MPEDVQRARELLIGVTPDRLADTWAAQCPDRPGVLCRACLVELIRFLLAAIGPR